MEKSTAQKMFCCLLFFLLAWPASQVLASEVTGSLYNMAPSNSASAAPGTSFTVIDGTQGAGLARLSLNAGLMVKIALISLLVIEILVLLVISARKRSKQHEIIKP